MTVYLVGAGPGDPDLSPCAASSCSGGPTRSSTTSSRRRSCSTRRPPTRSASPAPGCASPRSTSCSSRSARSFETVVRLKGGDPFLFGRGREEVEALAAAGIDSEVVPGVSALTAVPAAAGIPLTHRGLSAQVTVVTARSAADEELDFELLAQTPGTLVVFMGVARLAGARRRPDRGRQGARHAGRRDLERHDRTAAHRGRPPRRDRRARARPALPRADRDRADRRVRAREPTQPPATSRPGARLAARAYEGSAKHPRPRHPTTPALRPFGQAPRPPAWYKAAPGFSGCSETYPKPTRPPKDSHFRHTFADVRTPVPGTWGSPRPGGTRIHAFGTRSRQFELRCLAPEVRPGSRAGTSEPRVLLGGGDDSAVVAAGVRRFVGVDAVGLRERQGDVVEAVHSRFCSNGVEGEGQLEAARVAIVSDSRSTVSSRSARTAARSRSSSASAPRSARGPSSRSSCGRCRRRTGRG